MIPLKSLTMVPKALCHPTGELFIDYVESHYVVHICDYSDPPNPWDIVRPSEYVDISTLVWLPVKVSVANKYHEEIAPYAIEDDDPFDAGGEQ